MEKLKKSISIFPSKETFQTLKKLKKLVKIDLQKFDNRIKVKKWKDS